MPPAISKDDPASGASRVLIIDDDRAFCALIRNYLASFGYAVSAAHTGPAGVDAALAEPWHAIILDVMLPGLDGFEVLKKIRRAGCKWNSGSAADERRARIPISFALIRHCATWGSAAGRTPLHECKRKPASACGGRRCF